MRTLRVRGGNFFASEQASRDRSRPLKFGHSLRSLKSTSLQWLRQRQHHLQVMPTVTIVTKYASLHASSYFGRCVSEGQLRWYSDSLRYTPLQKNTCSPSQVRSLRGDMCPLTASRPKGLNTLKRWRSPLAEHLGSWRSPLAEHYNSIPVIRYVSLTNYLIIT